MLRGKCDLWSVIKRRWGEREEKEKENRRKKERRAGKKKEETDSSEALDLDNF